MQQGYERTLSYFTLELLVQVTDSEPSKFVDNEMWILKLLQAIFQVIHGDAAKNISKLLIKFNAIKIGLLSTEPN